MPNPQIDVCVVAFSFGMGSFCAAKRACEEYGKDRVILLFADTKYEDEDTYAWGRKAAEVLGARKVEIADGRNPWQIFFDKRIIGNSRVDPCSQILKREISERWLANAFDHRRTMRIFGIHWSEMDRFRRWDDEKKEWRGIQPRLKKAGWRHVRAPLCEKPFVSIEDMEKEVRDAGLWKQRLYELGFPHANCGGRCCKQGQKGWALLYKTIPSRFIECRDEEETLRQHLGKDVAMLKETVDGKVYPLPLAVLQKRLDEGKECEDGGMGGCSCFAGDDE